MLRSEITPDLLELLDTGSPGDIDFYCQYARQRGGPVLVLLCGIGRFAISMAKQGIPVIGIDSDQAMIDQAKRKAAEANAGRVMFVRMDPTNFVSDSKHPLVIIPGGALARLLTLEEQRQALESVYRSLALGGRLVLDLPVWNPGQLPSDQPVIRRLGPAGATAAVIQRFRKFDAVRQLVHDMISCEWLDDSGKLETKQYGQLNERFSTPAEVQLLLAVSGFNPTFYGSFDRHPFVPGAARMVIEAEKVT